MKAYERLIFLLIVLILFSLFSCDGKKQSKSSDRLSPKVIEATRKAIPYTDIFTQNIVAAEDVKGISSGKPKIIQLNSSSYNVEAIPVVYLGTPKKNIPGQGNFKLPVIVPVIDSSLVANPPEIIEISNPQFIDNNQISYALFNTLQGIKSNLIYTMLQDKQGNLWIGTFGGGLCKYDGRYLSNYSVQQGLSNNDIRCLLEDKKHNLWIGTGSGAIRFDGKTITIYTERQGLCSTSVWGLLEDSKGNIWINSSKGLSKYDGKTFTNFTDQQGFSKRNDDTFFEDRNGNLWFDTVDGFCKFDEKSFTYYPSSGATWPDLLATFKRNEFDGNSVLKFSAIEGLDAVSDNRIYPGVRGKVWYITDNGLDKYEGNSITHLGLDNGLNGANLQAVMEDRNNNLWIGSNGGGIAKINAQLFTHMRAEDGLSKENIRCIFADSKGNIWIGTWGGGVNKFDGNSITQYTTGNGLSSNNIQSIYEDKNGNIWLGTEDSGVNKFDGKTFTNYSRKTGLANNYITCILEDNQANLWFGTAGSGVVKYDGKTFTNFSFPKELGGLDIYSILEDKAGNIWLGSINNGVFIFDGELVTQYNRSNGLSDISVLSMLEDKQGNIWLGTADGGVNRFDGKSFTQYTTEQGLPNNRVNSMLEDKQGNIWFGTNYGLSRMRFEKKKNPFSPEDSNKINEKPLFKNYVYSDGFTGVGTWYNSLVMDKNGVIWAGAIDRITTYHQEEDVPDTIPPSIQLRGISIFNENINWFELAQKKDTVLRLQNGNLIKNFEFTDLKKWSYVPENLKLTYSNNFITFKFIGITTNKPDRVKYKYQLEGLDKNWNPLTNLPEAVYTNLSQGSYIFKVKAMNSEGYWSDELSYPVTIKPPWWFSKLAYWVYGILFLIVAWNTHLFLKARTIRAERQKAQKKELEQAREIKKAYTELKATQAQLIQSEKMASLGELTAGIAHEIQNPLNFVNNFSDLNKELVDELKEELTTGNTQLANEIADDIKENESKINHHGKRAEAIVKGMLLHSRGSSGQKELTDINALCDEYLRLSFHGFRAKDKSFNADFRLEADEKLPKIEVVPQDIGRVLLNLINNAFYAVNEKVKHSVNDYKPMVVVNTKLIGNKVEIVVNDNGNGVPESVKEKIFQPFFTTKPTGQGTGLGLSLSYDIVKAHRGSIQLKSQENVGTGFIIQIPVV